MPDAVILAAGYGKGLEPITHTRHKVLVPVLDKTLLEHNVRSLVRAGVKSIVIVVNYLKEQVVKEASRLAKVYDAELRVVDQGEPLGTGHALLKALSSISTEDFIVLYGDIYVEPEDVAKVISGGKPTIAGYGVEDPKRYGVLITDGGILREIIEKPETPPSNLVNAGLYYLDRRIEKYLENLPLSPRGEYELTDAINSYCSEVSVQVVELSYWLDIGRPWKLLDLSKHLLRRIEGQTILGHVEGGVRVRGPVVIEEGAEVLSGTYIWGPAYIGREAVVGPNAFIRPYSVVLRGARVGFNVEVKASIVMEDAHAAHQAYIGDSVVCEHANLGAGTILANLRFDDGNVKYRVKGVVEDTGRRKLGAIIGGYVKTGVNVSTVPGVKIGAYSWINPGVTVYRDVPPCTHVISEGESRPVKGECCVDLSVWRP